MKNESIVKPEAIKGSGREKAVYIPVDLPSRIVQKELKRRARKHRPTEFGDLYLLKKSKSIFSHF